MAATDFIDECRVYVCGGSGGDGCSSFRREKFAPRGGPDGGNGGRGGSVVLRARSQLSTLLDAHYRKHYRAQRGAHGRGARKHGRGGGDLTLDLPLGTIVRDDVSRETLCELLQPEQRWVAASGGRGGRGNACFATSTQRAPTRFEPGESGQERWLRLELKVLADVGLLGFPNAGKSTLVSRLSSARPRIADYPFTTLQPHLGTVELGDTRFVVADIPGLIPGAHRGAGLGDRFLRHVERTRLLVHLLDPQPRLENPGGTRTLLADYRALRGELSAYSEDLARRPELVCITKSDLVADPSERERLAGELRAAGLEARWISAAGGHGLDDLRRDLAAWVVSC